MNFHSETSISNPVAAVKGFGVQREWRARYMFFTLNEKKKEEGKDSLNMLWFPVFRTRKEKKRACLPQRAGTTTMVACRCSMSTCKVTLRLLAGQFTPLRRLRE
jgi:hypothetical protein